MNERGRPVAVQRRLDRTSVTQADVAAAAGVSTASVSRVLNNSPLVRPDIRARVEEAVSRLGYFPNSAARALALNRTSTVGAVIPTLNSAIFAEGVNAFERALHLRGFTLLLSVSNYDLEAERAVTLRMIERGVDAMMLIGAEHDPATIATLTQTRTPFVCTWCHASGGTLPTIGFDNSGAMAEVVDHLVSLGHTRLGMIAGVTRGNDRARDRVAGVRRALAAHGLSIAQNDLAEVAYEIEPAQTAFLQLMQRKAPPTAIICGNDVIAYGALFGAHAIGLAVPTDVSVVGFDNLSLSERLPPGLTTVEVPAEAMGEAAATHLADVVEGAWPSGKVVNMVMPTALVPRSTTAPPPTPGRMPGSEACEGP